MRVWAPCVSVSCTLSQGSPRATGLQFLKAPAKMGAHKASNKQTWIAAIVSAVAAAFVYVPVHRHARTHTRTLRVPVRLARAPHERPKNLSPRTVVALCRRKGGAPLVLLKRPLYSVSLGSRSHCSREGTLGALVRVRAHLSRTPPHTSSSANSCVFARVSTSDRVRVCVCACACACALGTYGTAAAAAAAMPVRVSRKIITKMCIQQRAYGLISINEICDTYTSARTRVRALTRPRSRVQPSDLVPNNKD